VPGFAGQRLEQRRGAGGRGEDGGPLGLDGQRWNRVAVASEGEEHDGV
jgi:hypothetical protein